MTGTTMPWRWSPDRNLLTCRPGHHRGGRRPQYGVGPPSGLAGLPRGRHRRQSPPPDLRPRYLRRRRLHRQPPPHHRQIRPLPLRVSRQPPGTGDRYQSGRGLRNFQRHRRLLHVKGLRTGHRRHRPQSRRRPPSGLRHGRGLGDPGRPGPFLSHPGPHVSAPGGG